MSEITGTIGTPIGNFNWWEIGAAAPTCIIDQYWDDVLLLAHFDNTDNPTTFTNEKGLVMSSSGAYQNFTSKFGAGAAFFDGRSYLDGLPAGLALSDDEYTLEAWVFPTELDDIYSPIFAWSDSTTNSEKFLAINSGGVLQMSDTSTYTAGGGSVALNVWTHVAAVYYNNEMTLYVNGVPGTTVPWTTEWRPVTTPMHMGSVSLNSGINTRNFFGWIDEARVTNKARYLTAFTPEAVQFCPASTEGSSPTYTAYQNEALTLGATGYWSFDEGLSTGIDLVGTHPIDLIQAGYDAAPLVTTGRAVQFGISGVQFGRTQSAPTFTSENLTINIFAKRGTSLLEGAEGLVTKGSSTALGEFDWGLSMRPDGTLSLWTQNLAGGTLGDSVWSISAVDDNTTHMITGTLEVSGGQTVASLYLDGVLEASSTWPGIIQYSDVDLNIGRLTTDASADRYYDGTIDELQIYDRPLTAQEISNLYALRNS